MAAVGTSLGSEWCPRGSLCCGCLCWPVESIAVSGRDCENSRGRAVPKPEGVAETRVEFRKSWRQATLGRGTVGGVGTSHRESQKQAAGLV